MLFYIFLKQVKCVGREGEAQKHELAWMTAPITQPQEQDQQPHGRQQQQSTMRPPANATETRTTDELTYKDQVRSHVRERTQRQQQRQQEHLATKQTLSFGQTHHHHYQQQQAVAAANDQEDHEDYTVDYNNDHNDIPIAHAVVIGSSSDRDKSIFDIHCTITKRKCQKVLIGTCIVVILILVATIGGYCALGKCQPSLSLSPTSAPMKSATKTPMSPIGPPPPSFASPSFIVTTNAPSMVVLKTPATTPSYSSASAIRSYIQSIAPDGRSANDDAIVWMENNVPIIPQRHNDATGNFTVDDEYFIRQLYALLSFYHSTNGMMWSVQEGWFNLTKNVDSTTTTTVFSYEAYCYWYGVTCAAIQLPETNGNVSVIHRIDLNSSQLQGPFPPDLVLLKHLQYLNVGGNNITGTIPEEYGSLAHLIAFHAPRNAITGTIPDAMSNWSRLRSYDVGVNQLIGTIPEVFIQSTPNLISFVVGNNTLSGTLSNSMGESWPNIIHFEVSDNKLYGTIPESLSLWSNATKVYLLDNDFTGTIPIPICNKSFALFESNLPPCV